MIVLDTAALLYWTEFPSRLTRSAYEAISQAQTIIISSISIWEIALKAKRGHIDLSVSLEDYIKRLQKVKALDIRAVNLDMWVVAASLDWQHRDPADRVIVATATLLKCPLITSDRVIADFYTSTIW
jgi:PIN domain nuclease of toxin-antitoxin system